MEENNKPETAIIKCIAKGCNNKVIIELKVTDMSNASKIFFKFCPEHQKMYDDKIKQDYQDQEKVKKEIATESVKSSLIKPTQDPKFKKILEEKDRLENSHIKWGNKKKPN